MSIRKWARQEGTWLPYLGVLIILFAAALIGAAFGRIDGKDLVGWAFPMIGTFLGAFLAFRLQDERERRAERRARIAAINRALLALGAQYNHLWGFKRRVLDEHVDDPARMLNVPAEGLGARFDARLAPEELVFLAFHGHAGLVMELSVEQGRFDACREVVAYRCDLMLKEIYPLVEQHMIRHRDVTAADVEAAFGERIFGGLVTATDQLYHHVPATVVSLLAAAMKLYEAAKAIFPEEKFLRVSEPRPPAVAAAESTS